MFSEMTIALAVSPLGILTAFKTFPSSKSRNKHVNYKEISFADKLTCPDIQNIEKLVVDGFNLRINRYGCKAILETDSH